MRRKNQLIQLKLLKQKNMFDKKLNFLSLLHLVNYKKFKSLKKRFILINYNLYKHMLFALKNNFFLNFNKYFMKSNSTGRFMLPVSFFLKRMYGKNTVLLNKLDNTNINYIWCSGLFFKRLKVDKNFFKMNVHIPLNGNNIQISTEFTETINPVELLCFQKEVTLNDNYDFNNYILYNISLLNIVEFYKILIICNIYAQSLHH